MKVDSWFSGRAPRAAFWLILSAFLLPSLAEAGNKSWAGAVSGNWNDGTKWSPAGVPASGDDVSITVDGTYTVTLNVNVTANSLTLGGSSGTQTLASAGQNLAIGASGGTVSANGVIGWGGGTLTVSGTLSVDGTFNWTGGTLGNGSPISMSVGSGGSLNLSGTATKTFNGTGTINNSGTATWTGSGNFNIESSGVFNNLAGGSFDVQNDASLQQLAGFISTFNNAGTFTKSAGSGITTIALGAFPNTGTVSAESGVIRFVAVGTGTGPVSSGTGNTFSASAGAEIQFRARHSFTDTTFSGTGALKLDGARATSTRRISSSCPARSRTPRPQRSLAPSSGREAPSASQPT